ncbi:MAG: hypothetical protein GXP26_15480 [Planctomycetes bacterium]|nr:hypothetical protein [Planctomycetota bacterium]
MQIRNLFLPGTTWLVWLLLLAPTNTQAEVPHVEIGQFPQEVATSFTSTDGLPSDEVVSIQLDSKGDVWAETKKGWAVFQDKKWTPANSPPTRREQGSSSRLAGIKGKVNQVARSPKGEVVVATDQGLLIQKRGRFVPLVVDDNLGRRWGTSDVRGAAYDSHGQLWFATLAGAACQTSEGWKFYTGSEGLPYNDFTVIEPGPEGVVWFGTHLGAVRFDGKEWAYRQGQRWLPSDDIRDIAVDQAGNAWFATAGGVGLIKRRMMTLAEKAEFYEDEMQRYIRRTPYGYVSEVGLAVAGDKTSKILKHASDNDGLWTSMYGVGECFAYAATGSEKAKDRAKQVFEALRFLQKVTQGGKHSPPKGYVARTIRSIDLPDPNIGRLERDQEARFREDRLWKVYEPRWPKSADGKWYWKSDTSSDELDGHYFFYPAYYDLVADTDEEKERVREVVRDLTDHLIEHGYNLVDHDGTPTRWGYYGPHSLNHDQSWWLERGLKSLSMLSYLTVAEHITGDPKYAERINELINDHAYLTNAMIYKIHRGIGSGNQSDDEMAFMSFYNLMKYTKNEDLRNRLMLSFFSAWVIEQPEMNPFFNFAYAAFGEGTKYSDQWGTHDLSPWDGWLEDSMATLKGFPLDRLNWACKNSHRLDLVRLPRQQSVEDLVDKLEGDGVGHRVNGKVIPVENRHFTHWNTNPWRFDYGGNGNQLANGTVYLLPYYMGLYHGFIQETP